jgi:membrane-associated progesterone receptor component
MMSLNEEDCNDNISSLSEKEKEVLAQWEKKFSQKYPKIGTVVPSMDLRVDELAAYDGRDPSKPMLLAIRGVIFDVSSAKEFYGPTGAYPFAGKECARALAKYSVEMDDCSDLLDDCSVSEMDALRSWEAQFHSKYKVVGHVMIS